MRRKLVFFGLIGLGLMGTAVLVSHAVRPRRGRTHFTSIGAPPQAGRHGSPPSGGTSATRGTTPPLTSPPLKEGDSWPHGQGLLLHRALPRV